MEKKFKSSRYNIFINKDDGDLIVFNSLNTSYIKIKEENKNTILNELNQNVISKQWTYFDLFKEKGFIVEVDTDEKKVADLNFKEEIFSKDVLELTIIPTDACNFNCMYCYQKEPYNYMTKKTEDSIIKYLEKNIRKYKKLVIAWFGGEPLLCKETIIRMMTRIGEICTRAKVPYVGRITTNGYELDLESFKKFISCKVLYYQITIDGVPEIHNIQRPHKTKNDSFEKIMSNLIDIKENIDSNLFKIALRTNITPKLVEKMDEFINILQKEFSNDNRFGVIWERVNDWGGEKIKKVKDQVINYNFHMEWFKKAIDLGIKMIDMYTFKPGMSLCEAYKSSGFIINHNGQVSKCTLALYDENFKDKNIIGYIDDNGNMKVNKINLSQWLIVNQFSKCDQCNIYPLCGGPSCPYSIMANGNDNCPNLKELLPYYIGRLDKENLIIDCI